MENEAPQKPLFANSPLGRVLTKRNLVIFAFVVIIFDVALTHYFFNSRQKAVFLSNALVAGREAKGPVALGDLTQFAWKRVIVTPKVDGARFWFSTYDTRTYIFDYIFDYPAGEVVIEIPPGSEFTPDSKFELVRETKGVRMRPAE